MRGFHISNNDLDIKKASFNQNVIQVFSQPPQSFTIPKDIKKLTFPSEIKQVFTHAIYTINFTKDKIDERTIKSIGHDLEFLKNISDDRGIGTIIHAGSSDCKTCYINVMNHLIEITNRYSTGMVLIENMAVAGNKLFPTIANGTSFEYLSIT